MVDRRARDEMAGALRSYMEEEITAFALDDALASVAGRTQDETVQKVGGALWYHYDDCKDHKIVATKERWDYFNRILLVLESDAELETVGSRWDWHLSQVPAAMLLTVFTAIAMWVGFGMHLLAYALPFGPLSMLLAWHNRRREEAVHASECVLTPFPSMGSMLAIRRRVRGFAKKRYPGTLSSRRIRDPFVEALGYVPLSILWCMLAPVVLVVQMLPGRMSQEVVRTPEEHAGSR